MLDLTQWQIDYMTLVRKEHVNLGQKLITIRKSLLKQMGRYAKASVHVSRTPRLNFPEGQAAALPTVTTRSFRSHEARSWLLDIRGFLISSDKLQSTGQVMDEHTWTPHEIRELRQGILKQFARDKKASEHVATSIYS